MRIFLTPDFEKDLKKFSLIVYRKLHKQLFYLAENLRHPSLHAKKYDEAGGVWQARVDKYVRFYFKIDKDSYILLDIRKHKK